MARSHTTFIVLTAAAFTLMLASPKPVRAGIVDSPLPVLQAGATTLHLYSVPAYVRGTGLGTFFACTSTNTAAMQVGVELFGSVGGGPVNDAAATSLTVAPGVMVVFGTSSAIGIAINSDIGGVNRGSARILATSRKLICTAYIADIGNAPPTSAWQLTIVKNKTQKGD